MEIFIPDEHVLKVPEIRLPYECDSAAETQNGSFNCKKMRSSVNSECYKPTLLLILSDCF